MMENISRSNIHLGEREKSILLKKYASLSMEGDPLERLEKVINWQIFLPLINKAFYRVRKSEAGRKPYNRLLMFKLLILQSLYQLSDHEVCYLAQDRFSFMRFLKLGLEEKVPDEKTLWAYREVLTKGEVIERLFDKFGNYLEKQGLKARCGSIVDASLVEAPRQRNSKEENLEIKSGIIPENFRKNMHRYAQKDVEARWTIKGNKTYFGYKDHINIDVRYKLIRSYKVTNAADADIHSFKDLLKQDKSQDNEKSIWGDGAYFSQAQEKFLKSEGYESKLIRRWSKPYPLSAAINRENHRRSIIRARVEHVFGFMVTSLKGKYLRTIGLARAKTKIGLMNLVYNFCRCEQILRLNIA